MTSEFEAKSLDPKVAAENLRDLLLKEIEIQISRKQLEDRNSNLSDDILLENYLKLLKRTKDPRVKDIESVLSLELGENRVDNVWESLEKQAELREQIRQSLIHGGGEMGAETGDKIPVELIADFTNHLRNIDTRELLHLSEKEIPKVLRVTALTALAVNLTLMLGEKSSVAHDLADLMKEKVGIVAEIPMDFAINSTTIVVVALYLLQAGYQVSDVGIKNYLRDNKFDTFLNTAGIADLGLMFGNSENAYAGAIRGLRALRGLKFFSKMKTVRDILEALKEVGPSLANLGIMYAGFSSIITLILVQLLGSNSEEFKDMESAFHQMLNLFYGDGFQETFSIIEEATEGNTASEVFSKTGVIAYMGTSVIGAIGVFQALIINQVIGTDRVERMVSYMSEGMSEGFSEVKGYLNKILTTLTTTNKELEALKFEVKKLSGKLSDNTDKEDEVGS